MDSVKIVYYKISNNSLPAIQVKYITDIFYFATVRDASSASQMTDLYHKILITFLAFNDKISEI